MIYFRLPIFVLLLLLTGITVLAQEATCPEIVQAALDAADENCSATGRNEACYGNFRLEATPQSGVDDFTFSTPGDIVSINAVENLTLSSQIAEAEEWGVALLQLQANLPDNLPGQNVTFLLFGAVEITNGVASDEEASTTPPLNPMQAFYFKSGAGDAPCAEAPDSGILVQTPEGDAEIEFIVNNVTITLGSTAYLQAEPSAYLTISLVEGEATVTADGESVTMPAGSQVQVPLDDEGNADGSPTEPQPYDAAKLALLPIGILPRTIEIAAPISAGGDNTLLTEGEWVWTPGDVASTGCEAAMIDFVVANFTPDAPFQLPGSEFDWNAFYEAAYGAPVPAEAIPSNPAPNNYVLEFPNLSFSWHYEMNVIDEQTIEGAFSAASNECTLVLPFDMTGS
jgi:hypothetical protein